MSLYDSYKPKSNIWLRLYEWAYELTCGCFDKLQIYPNFTCKIQCSYFIFLASITISYRLKLHSHISSSMNIIIISFLLKCFEGVKPLLYMLLHMVSFIIRYELNAA